MLPKFREHRIGNMTLLWVCISYSSKKFLISCTSTLPTRIRKLKMNYKQILMQLFRLMLFLSSVCIFASRWVNGKCAPNIWKQECFKRIHMYLYHIDFYIRTLYKISFLQNIGCVANFLFISAVELQKRFTFEMGIESYFLIIELYVVVDFLRRNSKKGF